MIRSYENRTDLRKEIPLNKPIILIVEPTNFCNFQCRFCPTTISEHKNYKHAPKRNMTLDEFKKVIDSAKKGFGRVKMLQIYNFGEPLVNKNICEMIEYAKDVDIADSLRIYTNGALLTPTLSRKLAEVLGKGRESIIQFSIEHISDDGYKEVSNVDVSYDNLLTNIAYFYAKANHKNTNVICKLINDCVTPEDAEKFKTDFAMLGDSVHVELLEDKSEKQVYKYQEEVITYDGHKTKIKKICANPFYILSVQSDLSVKACTADIFRLHTVGHLNENSLLEIWNGDALFKLRKEHLLGKTDELCSYCTYFAQQLDDIDDIADELFERLEKQRNG